MITTRPLLVFAFSVMLLAASCAIEPDDAQTQPPATVTGFLVDGGLTVSEALATSAQDVIAVRGIYFADATQSLLCELLAESFPPQCAGPRIPVDTAGIDLGPRQTAGGVTWSNDTVVIFGEIVGGTLVGAPMVNG